MSNEIIVDNFAGGGGASTGIALALGRDVDVAINHDPEAIAMHKANHPQTEHYCESVWDVDPSTVKPGSAIGLLWLSPDCKHFSKAKGGKPVEKKIRGLAGQVFRGGHAGGLSFGYRSIDAGAVHRLEIDEDQAPWVRWIFEHYADGWSCQKIAAELNVLGVKTGRGRTWAVSALYGNPNKGSGVLNNELYVGRYVWNRSQWRKDPDTGKRFRTIRPAGDWLIEDRPELRILDADLWQAVRDRMEGNRLANGGKGKGARPKTLLGGLMTCGKCGGAVIAVSSLAYGCAAHKDRGPAVCNGVRVSRKAADLRLLSVVREDLLSQSAVLELRDQVKGLLEAQHEAAASAAGTAKAAIADVAREIDHLVDAIGAIGHSAALAARLKDAEARLAKLVSDTVRKPVAPIKIDDVMTRYRRHLLALEDALKAEPERARAALREYFGEIVVEETGAQAWATFTTDPGRLLLQAAGDSGYGCGGRISHPEPRRIRIR